MRAFLLVIMYTLATALSAQRLVVYSMLGDIQDVTDSAHKPLKLRDSLTPNMVLHIPADGYVVLFDEKTSFMFTLKVPMQAKVKDMIADGRNSFRTLSQDYIAFVKIQIASDNCTTIAKCDNPGKVMQELMISSDLFGDKVSEMLICGYDGLNSNNVSTNHTDIGGFNDFRKKVLQDFNDFRNKVLKEYADFVRNPWEDVALQPAEEKPKEKDMEDVKPFVIDSKVNPIVPNFDENDKGTKPVTIIDILPTPRPLTYPEPVVPVEEDNGENESGEEKEGNDNEHYFNFFGTKMKCQWSNDCRFSLKGYDENAIADGIELLSTEKYSTLLVDCIRLRKEYHLSDWAYILMLRDLCNSICGEDTNESTLMQAFLYSQSGYKMRLALAGPKLKMMVATQFDIYGHSYYSIDGSNYYILDGEYDRVHICKAHFPKEQEMSLVMKDSPRLAFAGTETRMIGSRPYPDLKAEIGVNQNLMDFYSTYPTSECNHNVMTRWAMYANMEMDQGVRDQLYPQIRAMIEGKTQRKAAESILNWIQTAFPYEYDDKVWGRDRAFFAEESLYYPFCDCEDRSILFTRLIRDLLDLKCILIFYPGHLATGVQFTEDGKGDYIDIDGERFTICDPTIMGDGAPVGFTMPGMDNSSAKVIILD